MVYCRLRTFDSVTNTNSGAGYAVSKKPSASRSVQATCTDSSCAVKVQEESEMSTTPGSSVAVNTSKLTSWLLNSTFR